MEEKKVEIEVELTFGDFFRAVFWQSFNTRLILFVILTLIFTPLAIFGVVAMMKSGKFSFTILLPLLPLFIILLSLYSIFSSAKNSSKKMNHKVQWVFSDDGYKSFTPIGRTEANWNGIDEIKETSKDFLLIIQKPVFVMIPKRFFNESQITDFRAIVSRALGSKAKLKG
jgi:YcxB-like protein